MTHMDTGTYGDKVHSWRRVNPRDLLKRVIEENPKLSKEKCWDVFLDAVKADDENEDYFSSMAEYWFSNNWTALMRKTPSPEERAETKAASAKMVRETKKKFKEKATLIFLDTVQPNGKRGCDCTGRDCI